MILNSNLSSAGKKFVFFLITVLSYLFLNILSVSAAVESDGAYGLFSPKVEFVDNNLPTNCGPNDASIEIQIVREGTKTPVNNLGKWTVRVRNNDSGLTIRSYQEVSANTNTSPRICFDPVVNGLEVEAQGNSQYYSFVGPTILAGDSGNGFLETMRGNHFRGYLQLGSKGSTPFAESFNLTQNFFQNTPTGFVIKTNRLDTMLGNATQVNTTHIYAKLESTNQLFSSKTEKVMLPGQAESFSFGGQTLPEGTYYWVATQDMNGYSRTDNSLSTYWDFSNIPFTSMTDKKSFFIDNTAPTPNIEWFNPMSPWQESNGKVRFTYRVRQKDTGVISGIAYTKIWVEDSLGNVVFTKNNPSVPNANGDYKYNIGSAPGYIDENNIYLTKGDEYIIYAYSIDQVGNTSLTVSKTFSLAADLLPPILDFAEPYFKEDPNIFGKYRLNGLLLSTGSSNIDGHGSYKHNLCWGTDEEAVRNDPCGGPTSNSNLGRYIINAGLNPNDYRVGFNDPMPIPPGGYPFFMETFEPARYQGQRLCFKMAIRNLQNIKGYTSVQCINIPTQEEKINAGEVTVPTVSFLPPINQSYNEPFYSDSAFLGVEIQNFGGFTHVESRGVCYSLTSSGLPSEADIATLIDGDGLNAGIKSTLNNNRYLTVNSPSVNCIVWGRYPGGIGHTANIPFRSRGMIDGLSAGTNYYFRAFAKNEYGIGINDGNYTTLPIDYRFVHLANTPEFPPTGALAYNKNSFFNPDTNEYSEIRIKLGAQDRSTFFPADGSRRVIPYKAELFLDGNYSGTPIVKTGTIITHRYKPTVYYYFYDNPINTSEIINDAVSDSLMDVIKFNNVPLGTHSLRVTLNESPTFTQSVWSNRDKVIEIKLTDPNLDIQGTSASDDNSGGALIIDPNLSLIATPSVIRAGQTTHLKAEMDNVSGEMICEVSGGGVTFSQTHPGGGDGSRITLLEKDSDPLNSTQNFTFSCTGTAPGATTYSTTTRVTVIGSKTET